VTRLCAWCQEKPITDPRARFCSQKCRQAAFRVRRRRATEAAQGRPMVMAYADPPYPGLSSKYYRDEPTYAGEVNHAELIASLRSSTTYDGWALSTSSKALRDVLPLCPPVTRDGTRRAAKGTCTSSSPSANCCGRTMTTSPRGRAPALAWWAWWSAGSDSTAGTGARC